MFDLLIQNGMVVTTTGTERLNIGISGEKISWIGVIQAETPPARKVIDATDKYIFPGGIEAHAHIAERMHKGWTRGEEVWLPGPEVISRAAIFGGTTTVASFAFMDVHTPQIEFDANLAIEHRKDVFSGSCYTDFVFHPVLTGSPTDSMLDSIRTAIQQGTPTFKVFTTDVTSAQSGIKIADGSLLDVMKLVSENGGLIFAHAESDELVKHMEAKLARAGEDQWFNLHRVHTNLSEGLAFQKTIRMAQETSVPLFFAHVTGCAGVSAIQAARLSGQPVFGEVLHNYLAYTSEDYKKPDGGKYQTYPALKTRQDQDSLWNALRKGVLSVVSTDEYTTSYQIKTQGKTIATACGGHAGIETRGMYLFSEGFTKNRVTIERFVDAFSTAPAKILGLYPQKGAILPGSDADIVIWDPSIRKTIQLDDLHHGTDYSIWEGWEITGWPIMTILRGDVMVDGGKLVGTADQGKFVPRRISTQVFSSPVI